MIFGEIRDSFRLGMGRQQEENQKKQERQEFPEEFLARFPSKALNLTHKITFKLPLHVFQSTNTR